MRRGQGKARSTALSALKRLSALLLLSPAALSAWQSQLLPFNGGTGQYEEATVSFASRNWRLLDYSYTGYKLGTQPLATGVPCTVFPVSGSGDITAALQTAINSAQASGGIVRIPAGTFTLSAPLYITGNNVSIEGAGSNATFINIPSTYVQSDPRYEGLFTFGKGSGGWNKGWIDRGSVLTDVTAIVPEGQMYVDVADASAINVGDWITVRQYFWPGLSDPNSNSTWGSYTGWPSPTTIANRSYSFSYLRQVLSKAGLRLNLDAPIPWRLDPANNPVKVQQVPPTGGFSMRQNVGVSGLNLRFADNSNDASYSPARPAGAAVHFEGVRDGWVYDLVIHNFPRFAVQAESAARITVLDSQVYDCQDDGGDGFGYGFHWNESQQILVKRCYVESVRHAYLSQHPLSSFIVFTQDQSREARQGDDSHHSFVHGYLFDDHRSYEGSGARMEQRGSTSGNAYECLGSGVFWNFQGDDGRGGGADGGSLFMNPSPQGWGMIIGGPGGAYKVFDGDSAAGDLIPPAAGLQVGPTLQAPGLGSKDQNALYEGIGQSGLTPASLYETQLLRRLGSLPADFATSCGAGFSRYPITPSLDSGPGTLVYDSDHLGWVPQLGGACDPSSTAAGGTHTIQCWADSPARDHSTGSGESALITVNGVNWNILMSFTGPSQPRNTYTSISFWAYSSQADVQLHFDVAQRDDGTYNDLNDASTLINIPVANAWTQVTVPMSVYGSGATLFNKIQISSSSTNAGATVYLDDMRLNGGVTPSPTPSQTPSGTASQTLSPSPSPTATQTASPSRTATRTPSPASSATPSASPSATGTSSPSSTATATLSPSASATMTATFGPSASASPTATVTLSPSASPSASPTGTLGASPSPSATGTGTFSPSPSVSPSETPAASASPTGTPTATLTPSARPSASPSVTATRSLTPSSSATRSPSLTQSPVATATPSASVTLTPTPTRSATLTTSPSLTVTAVTPTPTETFTPVASATASPEPSGPLAILGQVPLPNPNPVELRVLLGSAAESLRARYYSPAMIFLAEQASGPRPQGWSTIAVPAGLPPGLVYAVLEARQGERHSLPVAPLRLYFIP